VDPQLDTHRLYRGAVLVKLYSKEHKYRVVGLHTGRCTAIDGKPVSWCHEGFLMAGALSRLRSDVTRTEEHDKEAAVEVKVVSANFRKMSILEAKKDLKALLSASSSSSGNIGSLGGASDSPPPATLKPVDADRARDLLVNAEAAGLHAVSMLMDLYKNNEELQTQAMRVCVRILLGTHVQHGKYLSQVEAIASFGELGVVKHTVMIMRKFPESTEMTVHALWLLALMTQNAANARDAGREGACRAVVAAMKGFAEFGRANVSGQKWGAACVTNMARVPSNRAEMEKEGIREAVAELVDNSPAVSCDWSCVVAVLGAVTELARKPHFGSRIKLVGARVQWTVWDMQKRLEEELEVLQRAKGRGKVEELEVEVARAEEKKTQGGGGGEEGEGEGEGGGEGGEGEGEEEATMDHSVDTGAEEDGIHHRKMFTAAEIGLVLEASSACMDALSYGVPESVWSEARERTAKFDVDWNVVAAGLHLDKFTGGRGKADIKSKGKLWRQKTKGSNLTAMRSRFSERGLNGGKGETQNAAPRAPVRGVDF